MLKPLQRIIFGSPGTGKSHSVRTVASESLGIQYDEETKILPNTVKTVFHPEYTYADFMGKLLPLTQGKSVIYKFYPGHFLRVLGRAYKSLIEGNQDHHLLVIDELNRGNAAAIFGTVFQLLDREKDGWSSYEVNIPNMELVGLLSSMDYDPNVHDDGKIYVGGRVLELFLEQSEKEVQGSDRHEGLRVLNLLKDGKISIPPNLSLIATINTSDESIYYLDSAFKRRWDWQYIDSPKNKADAPDGIKGVKLHIESEPDLDWASCVVGVNRFIKSHHQTIRRIEDKQIGWWFIKPENNEILLEAVEDKLMFYLWDSVFSRDKKPLKELIQKITKGEVELITYADFIGCSSKLMKDFCDRGNGDK